MGLVVPKRRILTRCLSKTGQSTSYNTGDDGQYQKGWWLGRLLSTNKVRFIAKSIGGDDVVIDRATGLLWAAKYNQAGCNNEANVNWSDALAYAEGLTFAGFSDWRLPNVNELVSLLNFGSAQYRYSDYFSSGYGLRSIWSSNTWIYSTTWAVIVQEQQTTVYIKLKTDTCGLRCVRNIR